MIKCVPTSKALNVHHWSPPPQPVHKADDGDGLWWMRLKPPSRGLYRDINQLSASDKIRCSGYWVLFKTWMRFSCSCPRGLSASTDQDESTLVKTATDNFFFTKRSRHPRSFASSYIIRISKSCSIKLWKGIYINTNRWRTLASEACYNPHQVRDNATMSILSAANWYR